MRRWTAITFAILCAAGMFCSIPTLAQQSEGQRKILNKVIPVYPELARHMNLHGAVRLEVVVAPNGTVKSMKAVGGSPLLLQAAQGAIPKWRWAPAPEESHELIELKFGTD
jgi:TonB family protein